MKLFNRETVFTALVGSHNYNLNQSEFTLPTGVVFPASDKDYKAFVLPTFKELYEGETYTNSTITQTEDVEIHDIRKFIELLFKSNLSYLEVLFSKDIAFDTKEMKEIFSLRNEIFNMNLPKLYNSSNGTFFQKMSALHKGTESTQILVDAFGYDTKQAQHAFRNLDFAIRYEATGFKDVEKALRYGDGALVSNIKQGHFTRREFEYLANKVHKGVFTDIRDKFYEQPVNHELKEHLDNLVMKMVEKHIKGEVL